MARHESIRPGRNLTLYDLRYFVDCRRAEPAPPARDAASAERLWRESERLVGA